MKQLLVPPFFVRRSLPLASLALGAVSLGLVACGGGGGGGGSNSGQAPDPVVVDIPVAYVQRPIPLDEDGEPAYPDVFEPDAFNPGGELYIKARATAQAEVLNVTRTEFDNNLEKYPNYTPDSPNYDVKDVSASADGSRLVFAMRAPLDPDMDEDDPEQPTWNIWEYNLQSKLLRRIISSDFEAEKGQDVAPHYLPDGRILFTSDRQKRSKEILLDEGKPQFGATAQQDNDITSFLLHSVKDDGTDIQQLSYNQSHDIQPTVMPNGRLLFMRWLGTGQNERLSFYTSNPDGTDVQFYFGDESLNEEPAETMTEAPRLFRPQVMADGRIAAIYMQNSVQLGGDMVVVDGTTETEGEVESISIKPVDIGTDVVSLSGRFASLSPLYDGTNRLLVSWSQCRLLATATEKLSPCLGNLLIEGEPIEGYEEAPPFYGIWIYDIKNQTQLPVVLAEDGKVFSEALALEALAAPPAFIAPTTDPDLAVQNLGLLHIRSVYDVDGEFNPMGSGAANIAAMAALPAEQRPARFVRLLKAVSVPDNDTLNDQDDNIYGNLFNNNTGIVEILGYAPVEPDGSVMVTVPSDVAFNLEVLDVDGRRIGTRLNQLIHLRPGELRESNGIAALGRASLEPPALNTGAATAASFPNTLRYDRLGVPVTPAMGETMAEFAARTTYCTDPVDGTTCIPMAGPGQERNLRKPTVDLIYNDEWTTPVSARAESFAYRYSDLNPNLTPDTIPAPTPTACRDQSSWNSNCRVVINYEYHIQPFWERERAAMTVGAATATSCIGCHSPSTEVDGNTLVRVPDAQLDLTRIKLQANARMVSYTELTAGDNRQILNAETGLLEDELIPTGECNVDIDGNPIVDEDGVCTDPVLVTVPVQASMSRNGARASARFFNKFSAAGGDAATHLNFLNDAELKLLSEWLDTNGRYYTNPFEMALTQ